MTALTVRETQAAATAAGIVVLPVKEDGSKRPDVGSWAQFQETPPSQEFLAKWFPEDGERSGLGFVCGAVSGGLELLDFDERGVLAKFVERCQAAGLGEVIDRGRRGLPRADTGRDHLLWRCEGVEGNTKLAARPCGGPPECRKHQAEKPHVLIETRGDGGYSIAAPSNGRTHESGMSYELLSGSVESIVTITEDERRDLLDVARSFDQMPVTPVTERRAASGRYGARAGDDFNRRASWRSVLEGHGWTWAYKSGALDYWRRPGKARGTSATTGLRGGDPEANYLWVFSTSTELEGGRGYSPFAARAFLDHEGDFKAAARALFSEGFGGGSEPDPQGSAASGDAAQVDLNRFPRSETGNAEAFAALYSASVRYDHRRQRYLLYDEPRWRPDTDGELHRMAKATVRARQRAAMAIEDEDARRSASCTEHRDW